jgi:hypothetical protein
VIEIGGDGNQVDNNVIEGGSVPLYNTDAYTIAGVYIMCGDNNTVWNNQIKNNHSGVIIEAVSKVTLRRPFSFSVFKVGLSTK